MESLPFLKNFCFQQLLRSWKNVPISSTVTDGIACGSLYIAPRCLWHSMIRRKMGQKVCHRENSFFLKCLFLTISQVPKKWSCHLQNICQKTSRTPTKFSLTFVMLDKTKEGAKIFSSLERLPFFQIFVFSTISQILEKCFYKNLQWLSQ